MREQHNMVARPIRQRIAGVPRFIRVPGMRSLVLKLTLAFLCVGLLGALLVAFFAGQRTQEAFDQFVNDRGRAELVTSLEQYYQNNGGWAGVARVVEEKASSEQEKDGHPPPITLIDSSGRVVLGDGHFQAGMLVSRGDLERATPLVANNAKIGWLLYGGGIRPGGPGSPENAFRQRVTQALTYGAIGASCVALLLGLLLARTLTRPLRELTVATEALAQGALGEQVAVRSRDELGTLATSFNRMSADLAQSTTLRRQMTADIAHDLRTPLSVILGYTEALREGKLPPDQDIFDTMHTEAQHLQHLIDDLRTLSLADAGELPLARQPAEPRALLERAAAAIIPQAEAHGIHVVIQAEPDLPDVSVDVERVAQVLGNLLGNALRYTPTGGSITLSAMPSGNTVTLQVADTGSGIAANDLPHIFERFYRADASRQHDGSSGLGLAIVKSIVDAHGGRVTVESEPGKGTTFNIALPLAATND